MTWATLAAPTAWPVLRHSGSTSFRSRLPPRSSPAARLTPSQGTGVCAGYRVYGLPVMRSKQKMRNIVFYGISQLSLPGMNRILSFFFRLQLISHIIFLFVPHLRIIAAL